MLCETRAFIASVQTGLREVSRAILHGWVFLKTIFGWSGGKIILILSSCWWHFVTATSAIDDYSFMWCSTSKGRFTTVSHLRYRWKLSENNSWQSEVRNSIFWTLWVKTFCLSTFDKEIIRIFDLIQLKKLNVLINFEVVSC